MHRPTDRARRRTTVLVASSSPMFEKRAARLFHDSDFATACAFEWEDARLSVTRTQPGIVLVDGASAAGHVHAVAAEAAARGIPLLITHGPDDASDVAAAARTRMPHGAFVVVPMTRDGVRGAVDAIVGRAAEASRDGAAMHYREAPDAAHASLASTASRRHPLLILHDGHAMRCWPTMRRRATRSHGTSPLLDWTIEIDGMAEHLGPASALGATSREVVTRIRRWWDADRAMPADARIVTSHAEE